ncbi:MAG: hypothetical protein A3F67_09610 [Verrucomicrobia bacterium RIFCSPHIGHO2_12_FULL_41_10]|nr:MAG: hypothetical protein A3F67_09610 [Verrucomicrobia bacterium RIFCSPHIGHO2_12_FULL_41_10]HLB33987.1 chorismate mutase [Chthoniobacterales bacterium]
MLAALILGLVLASSSWSQVPSSIPATIVSKKNQFFPTEDQKHLVHLMEQRLLLSRKIALAKEKTHLPILDRKREQFMMRNLLQQGVQAGLSEKQVTTFFTAQIEASRELQEETINDHLCHHNINNNLFSQSTEAAKDCVTPVLESSGMPYTFRALRSEAPCPSSASATLKTGSNIPLLTISSSHLEQRLRPQMNYLNKEIIATLANLQKKNTPYSIDFAQYAQNDLRHHKISDPIATLACKPLLFSQQAEYKFKF